MIRDLAELKRPGVIITMAFLMMLGFASLTYADNGPHGGYSAMTEKCAACHRAHTAKGDNLLAGEASATDKSGFCYSCHSGGTGAYTDVRNGLFLADADVPDIFESTIVTNTDRPLMSGGFENVRMNVTLTGTLDLAVTSMHMVSGGSNIAWGYGSVSSTEDAGTTGVSLTCTNCHNPHGGAGAGNTKTFRILKGNNTENSPLFSNGTITLTAGIDVPDVITNTQYYISSKNKSYYYRNNGAGYADSYFGQHQSTVANVSIYAKLSVWCAQCHTRYKTGMESGPGHANSGDAVFSFRHKTNLENDFNCTGCHRTFHTPPSVPHVVYPGCITCHVAHGTGARTGPYSDIVPWPDDTTTPDNYERSALLRLDGRGVCMQCHPWGTGQQGY